MADVITEDYDVNPVNPFAPLQTPFLSMDRQQRMYESSDEENEEDETSEEEEEKERRKRKRKKKKRKRKKEKKEKRKRRKQEQEEQEEEGEGRFKSSVIESKVPEDPRLSGRRSLLPAFTSREIYIETEEEEESRYVPCL